MNFLNPLLPQIQETAWESLLLGKAIWGKQGCILCLLINTNLPTQAQNFAGENDQKNNKKRELEEEMKEQSSCQAIPLFPSKNDWLLPQWIAAFVLQQFIPSWCQRHRQITLVSTNERQAGSRGHLCTNPSPLAGLQSHFFPALLPLPGHKPVLLGQASRSSGYNGYILASLFLLSPFALKQFLWSTQLVMGWVMLCTEIQQINLELQHVST